MPNQPKTPLRSFRVEDHVWLRAVENAKRRGTTLSEILRKTVIRESKRGDSDG